VDFFRLCPKDAWGILIGRVLPADSTIVVEDYELACGDCVPFVSKEQRLATMITRAQSCGEKRVVGYFHSRGAGWLSLDDEDLKLASRLFPGPNNIFLMVRCDPTREAVGAFFYWEGHKIRSEASYREFPFEAPSLKTRLTDGEQTDESEADPSPLWKPKRRSWIPLAGTWAACAALTFWYMQPQRGAASVPLQDSQTHPSESADTLNLKVVHEGRLIEIAWNSHSPAATAADHGTVTIHDGSLTTQVQLDKTQIRTGRVYYGPPNGDIGIRLDVSADSGKSTTESVQVVSAPVLSPPAAKTAR